MSTSLKLSGFYQYFSPADCQVNTVTLHPTDTKNNEARLVPLTQAATEVFKQALNNPVRPLNCDLVFFGEPGEDGKRGSYAYTKVWNQAKKQAGLDDFRSHVLK